MVNHLRWHGHVRGHSGRKKPRPANPLRNGGLPRCADGQGRSEPLKSDALWSFWSANCEGRRRERDVDGGQVHHDRSHRPSQGLPTYMGGEECAGCLALGDPCHSVCQSMRSLSLPLALVSTSLRDCVGEASAHSLSASSSSSSRVGPNPPLSRLLARVSQGPFLPRLISGKGLAILLREQASRLPFASKVASNLGAAVLGGACVCVCELRCAAPGPMGFVSLRNLLRPLLVLRETFVRQGSSRFHRPAFAAFHHPSPSQRPRDFPPQDLPRKWCAGCIVGAVCVHASVPHRHGRAGLQCRAGGDEEWAVVGGQATL